MDLGDFETVGRAAILLAGAGDYTNNAVAPTTIAGTAPAASAFAFPLGAGDAVMVEAWMTAQCSGAGGLKYQVNAPAGWLLEGWLFSSMGTMTTLSYQRLAAINTLSAAVHTVAGVLAPDNIRFTLRNPTLVPGWAALQAAVVTAGQIATVKLGSVMDLRKAHLL